MTTPDRSYPLRTMRSVMVPMLLIVLIITACDDSTAPETEISIQITQPTDSSVVRDSVMRILTEISSNCGCQAHVEFHIDGVHQYSDYLPYYHFDLDIRDLRGWHTIAARVVVENRGDAWDSVRVLCNPPDSLTGRSPTAQF